MTPLLREIGNTFHGKFNPFHQVELPAGREEVQHEVDPTLGEIQKVHESEESSKNATRWSDTTVVYQPYRYNGPPDSYHYENDGDSHNLARF